MFFFAFWRNTMYKSNIFKVIKKVNKPSGLEKIYLFPSPFPKTFIESQSWMKQADISDTETPGISKKCPYKKLSTRYSAHNTALKLYWIKADPLMTRKYISYPSCDIPYCHHQSLCKEHLKLCPSNYCTSKRGGTHGNKHGNLGWYNA